MKQHRVDTVFFDAAGTLFGVRGSVGEIYGRYAEQFGFHNGGDQSVQQQIEKAEKEKKAREEAEAAKSGKKPKVETKEEGGDK